VTFIAAKTPPFIAAIHSHFSKGHTWAFHFLGSGTLGTGISENGDTPSDFVPQLSSFQRPVSSVQDKYRYIGPMEIGYARVSTAKQDLDRQIEALRGEGIPARHIYVDKK
jgi:hypothetical protein